MGFSVSNFVFLRWVQRHLSGRQAPISVSARWTFVILSFEDAGAMIATSLVTPTTRLRLQNFLVGSETTQSKR